MKTGALVRLPHRQVRPLAYRDPRHRAPAVFDRYLNACRLEKALAELLEKRA